MRVAGVLLAVYSCLLLVAVLSPSNGDQSAMLDWLGNVLGRVGLPGITFGRLEVVMNAVIVAPVSLLGSLLRPRSTWRDWTAWGFLAAGSVELVQLVVLPGRVASFSDVVANTGGALLGALVMAAVRLLRRRPVPTRVPLRTPSP
jgi:glycopeptide antibiotics resistance protein